MTSLPRIEDSQGSFDVVEQTEIVHRPRLTLIAGEAEGQFSPMANIKPADEYLGDWLTVQTARVDETAFEALHEEFVGLIFFKASNYFLPGGDAQDLIQEGTIGFYKGVRDYDGRKSSLRNFLSLCIDRQILTAVKAATRRKHSPLNRAISFNSSPAGTEGELALTLEDMLPDKSLSPSDIVTGKEELRALVAMISTGLSSLESGVLSRYMDGYSYEVIAERLGVNARTVDNALQRAKKKIGRYLQERDRPAPEESKHAANPANDECDLEQEQAKLGRMFDDWHANVYSRPGSNLSSAISDLRTQPEARDAVISEARGYLALIALDSEWASPLAAYREACHAVMKQSIELSTHEQSSEDYVTDTLIDAALTVVNKIQQ